METQQHQLSFDESIKQVMSTLPPVIRNYISKGKFTIVARNLTAKYGLRIDQSGVLERELMLLLMGIENPNDFMKVLNEEAKIDQKTVRDIVQDVNKDVFTPLREEEENNAKSHNNSVNKTEKSQIIAQPEHKENYSREISAQEGHSQVSSAPVKADFSAKNTEEKKSAPAHTVPTPSAPMPTLPSRKVVPRTLPEHIAPLPPKAILPKAVTDSYLKPVANATFTEKHNEQSLLPEGIDEENSDKNIKNTNDSNPDKKTEESVESVESTTLKFASPPKDLPGAMPPAGEGSIKGTLSTNKSSVEEPKKEQVPQPQQTQQPQTQPKAQQSQPAPSAPTPSAPITHYSTDPYREPIDEPSDS